MGAEKIFEEYLSRTRSGEEIDFEEFCRDHPRHRDALEALHSAFLEGKTPVVSFEDIDTTARPLQYEQIGPYRLLEKLGEGGFGVVYKAKQREPVERLVALKIMRKGMDSASFLERFEAEKQALATLDHASIVEVYDAGIAPEGEPYFVMRYIDGIPLGRFVRERTVGLERRLELFERICEAIHHAHASAALIHRDLKPDNILVMEEELVEENVPGKQEVGTGAHPARKRERKLLPKVIDFGLVKAVGGPLAGKSITAEGVIMGTPEYMSPEQASLEEREIDFRTDVYSLGVILYGLVTNTVPHSHETLMAEGVWEFPRRLRELEVESPRSRLGALERGSPHGKAEVEVRFRGQLRSDIDRVVMKALAKDRTERYATVADLQDDIARYRRQEAVKAHPPSLLYRARKFVRKHRTAVLSMIAALGLIGAFMVVSHVLEEESKREQVREKLARGRDLWSDFQRLDEETESLKQDWQDRVRDLARPQWLPVWERKEEVDLWARHRKSLEGKEKAFLRATQILREGLNTPADASEEREEIRSLLEEIGRSREEEAFLGGGVPFLPEHFRSLYSRAGGEKRVEVIFHELAITSVPPGAEIYCYRYHFETSEARRIPYPFQPDRVREAVEEGLIHRRVLRVERVWPEEVSRDHPPPFQAGDEIRSVRGSRVDTREDLARALRGVVVEEEVTVVFERGGQECEEGWTPFPLDMLLPEVELDPRLVHSYLQFGLTFSANPLAPVPECRVGKPGENPVRLRLPGGSYLFLFKKSGFVDARLPFVAKKNDAPDSVRIEMFREAEVPQGCLPVSPGVLITGGDPDAFNPMPPDYHPVRGFFMGQHEVTLGQWLEFVNSPGIVERINKAGMFLPRTAEVLGELEVAEPEARIAIIPSDDGEEGARDLLFKNDASVWRLRSTSMRDWPAIGISYLAAIEYLHWRTGQAAKQGHPWRYRLPTNLEWEWAARGADRRFYPWGDYLIWSFCWSTRGSITPLDRVGVSPVDESVFGIRDLAGSVAEHIGERHSQLRNRYYRGGSFDELDAGFFRASSRHSMLPEWVTRHHGLRFVVDIPARE